MDNWTMTTQGLSPLAEISSRLLAGMMANPSYYNSCDRTMTEQSVNMTKALIAELEKENEND